MKIFFIAIICTILCSGCLTLGYKEYRFQINSDHSGTLTIKFVNIRSSCDDVASVDSVRFKDYSELINDFVKGTRMEEDFSRAQVLSKKLFEEKGQLCGEVVLKFDSLSQVNIFQYDKNGPYMLLGNLLNEKYSDSNGKQGPEYFPAVLWDNTQTMLYLKNSVDDKIDTANELLSLYKKN